MSQLSSKLKQADSLLARKDETLDSEKRRLQLAQRRLDNIKAQQEALKKRRDMLNSAKRSFQRQESDAAGRARDLKVCTMLQLLVFARAFADAACTAFW